MSGCCKEVPKNKLQDYEGLPDVTFMCMARMAYHLSCVAEFFYTGRERRPWNELSDDTCATYAGKVRGALRGTPPGDDQLDQLFARMLRSLTTNV